MKGDRALTTNSQISDLNSRIPKGYKQTEVGVIPEDWDISDLNSVSSDVMQNGVFYKPSRKGSGVKLINVGDLYKRTPIDLELLDLFDANDSEKERFKVKNGDLFFTRSSVVPSGIAHCNVYLSNLAEDVVFDSHVIRARPNQQKVNPLYIFRFCISPIARKYLIAHAKTGSMTTIDQGVLGRCPIILPTIAEQNLIARALSDTDALIESLEQLLAKKRQIKQGAMQELLSHQDGWIETTLGDITERIIGGGTPSRSVGDYWNGNIPWMTVKDFACHSSTQTSEYITQEGLTNSSSNLIPRNTIITSTRMALGKAVVFDVEVSINQDLKAIISKRDIETKFLYYWFQFHETKIANMGSGSTVMGISLDDLRKIAFSKPSKLEQQAIATILSDMDLEIGAIATKLTKARQLKQGMMHELLTGRIRLIEGAPS